MQENNQQNIDFEALVSDAIDHIPQQYQEKIQNVVFKVEDEPTELQRKELGLRRCDALYGLYQGVPMTQRNGSVHSIVPDVITVFKYPMMLQYPDEKILRKQVYETIWHEVAHYFGLNHRDIHAAKH